MQSGTRGALYVIAIIFFAGVIDLTAQIKEGEDFKWGLPIIYFGFRMGFPLVLTIFPDMFKNGDRSSLGPGDYGYGGGDNGGTGN